MLKIKYSDNPDYSEVDGFEVVTASTYTSDDATIEQLVKIVERFLKNGEDVDVQIKHKMPK